MFFDLTTSSDARSNTGHVSELWGSFGAKPTLGHLSNCQPSGQPKLGKLVQHDDTFANLATGVETARSNKL